MTEPRSLADDPEGFRALCERAPELGYSAAVAEKDYWATRVLRAAVATGAELVFKGGTSLSKAYGIIERFSEDIDLIVVVDSGMGSNARKRFLRGIADASADATGLSWAREAEGTGFCNARLTYDTPYSVTPPLTSGVLLEMGTRGGPEPAEVRSIKPLLADAAEFVEPGSSAEYPDLGSFDVTTLHPARTLAEKLAFLHHRASQGDLEALERGARHLYDVAMVLRHGPMVEALSTTQRVSDLMADIDGRSDAAGWGYTTRPADGFASSPAFAQADDVSNALRRGYELVVRDLVWGDAPKFDDVLATVEASRQLI